MDAKSGLKVYAIGFYLGFIGFVFLPAIGLNVV
jgi:hypothetical protein